MSVLTGIGLFLLRNWKVVLPVLAALALAGYILWLRADNADLKLERQELQTQLAQAEEINRRNSETMRRMDENLATERAATSAVQTRVNELQAEVNSAEQELSNAPGANEPAGEFFDALGDSLRAIDARGDATGIRR